MAGTDEKHSLRREQLSPLLILSAAMLFSLGGILVKLVPWNSMSICSARSIIAALELALYMKIRKHKFVFNRSVLLGGVAMGLSSITYVVANKLTTAANAILIQYTAPVFIIFFMWLFFREKPTKLDIGATVVISAGIILFFIDGIGGGEMIGNLVALASGITYSLMFMMKKFKGSDNISCVMVGCIVGAVAGLPWLFRETVFTPASVGGVLTIGIFQFGLAYICMAEGLRYTPPLSASLISMVEPVLNPILAAVVINEFPGPIALTGAFIVVCGVIVYNILKEHAAHVKTHPKKFKKA